MHDIAILTSYFNSAGYSAKRDNYLRFADGIRAAEGRLWTVECAFGGQQFELPLDNCTLRVRSESVMWQKERLLNLLVAALPPEISKVAWLDCDLLFENDSWLETTSKLLEEKTVVQLFDTAVRLPNGHVQDTQIGERYPSFGATWARAPGMARNGDYVEHGHTGFAWAARRDLLDRVGLYEMALAGTADHMMAHAFTGTCSSACVDHLVGQKGLHREHFVGWARSVSDYMDQNVGFVPGRVLHLWHGETAKRRYYLRSVQFQRFSFDPCVDVRIGDSGALEWASLKRDLHKWSRDFFEWRQEDGQI